MCIAWCWRYCAEMYIDLVFLRLDNIRTIRAQADYSSHTETSSIIYSMPSTTNPLNESHQPSAETGEPRPSAHLIDLSRNKPSFRCVHHLPPASPRRMEMQHQTKTYQVTCDEAENTIHITVSQPFSGSILGLSTWSSALFLANRVYFLGDAGIGVDGHSGENGVAGGGTLMNGVEETGKVTNGIDRGGPVTNGTDEAGTITNGIGRGGILMNGIDRGGSLTNGHAQSERGKRVKVLEIGAGTGLAGLSAALLWEADVVLTDIAECTSNLAKTIALNAEGLAGTNSTVRAGTLDWKEPDRLALYGSKAKGPSELGQFDVIIAADTIYDEYHPELITNVVAQWLSRGKSSKVIMGYPLRVMHLTFFQDLWVRFERLGLVAAKEGRVDVGEEWDDERLCEWVVWMWKDGASASAKAPN